MAMATMIKDDKVKLVDRHYITDLHIKDYTNLNYSCKNR